MATFLFKQQQYGAETGTTNSDLVETIFSPVTFFKTAKDGYPKQLKTDTQNS